MNYKILKTETKARYYSKFLRFQGERKLRIDNAIYWKSEVHELPKKQLEPHPLSLTVQHSLGTSIKKFSQSLLP